MCNALIIDCFLFLFRAFRIIERRSFVITQIECWLLRHCGWAIDIGQLCRQLCLKLNLLVLVLFKQYIKLNFFKAKFINVAQTVEILVFNRFQDVDVHLAFVASLHEFYDLLASVTESHQFL